MKRFAAVLLFAMACSAAPALAAQTVELRADVAVHGGRLTLGDLFDGAGPAASVVVASGAQGSTLVLDAARVQALAQSHGLDWANPQGMRRVIARSDTAGGAGPIAVSGAARAASVLVYARDLQAGEVLQPQDLMWSKSPAFGVPLDAPRDADSIIGQAAKRPLRAGSAVAQRDVAPAQVVKKDDVVSVTYQAGGIKLVLQAKAVRGAALGETLEVVNPASKKVIQAVATGADEAVVGPEAERIKSSGRPDPQLLASLH